MTPNPARQRHDSMRREPLAWWFSRFTEVPPVGHVLRACLHGNWTRFHSLPESKRYPTDESEYAELLRRHLAVAGELFTVGEPLYVYRSHLGERKLKGKHRHQVAGRQLRDAVVELPSNASGALHCLDEQYSVRALSTRWIPDFFGHLTRRVANWEEVGVTLVAPSTKNIYCPYDGGMDIFAFSVSPALLEAKFRSWMSSREDRM